MDAVNDYATRTKIVTPGSPYPVETVENSLQAVDKIVEEHGSGRPISKEEIAKTLNKSVGTLSMFFSTLVQYGIFTLVYGKGYIPSDLYRRLKNPHQEDDVRVCKLSMFRNAPLYGKIIDNLNNHQLPASERMLANRLKDEPYLINTNSADRAAKVFFENARELGLLAANNTLKFSLKNVDEGEDGTKSKSVEQTFVEPLKVKNSDVEDDLFTMPIPLPGKKKAYLKYPLETLTKRDIRVIRKALDFIESSIDEGESSEDTDDLRDQHLGR